MVTVKCAWCGKEIYVSEEWAYRRGFKSFCTWKCLRAFDRDKGSKNREYKRRDTATLTVDGVTKPLKVWAEEKGIPYGVLYQRVYNGRDPFMRKEKRGRKSNAGTVQDM